VNCGQCTSKKGKSCATEPVCNEWTLHKFRRTWATLYLRSGVSTSSCKIGSGTRIRKCPFWALWDSRGNIAGSSASLENCQFIPGNDAHSSARECDLVINVMYLSNHVVRPLFELQSSGRACSKCISTHWTSKICNANFASGLPLPESAMYSRFSSGTKIEDFAR
jgi:hypothetical protein